MSSHEHEFKVVCPLAENPELYHYMKALPETTKRVNRIWWFLCVAVGAVPIVSAILAWVK
jgi:hypothetical protein